MAGKVISVIAKEAQSLTWVEFFFSISIAVQRDSMFSLKISPKRWCTFFVSQKKLLDYLVNVILNFIM